MMRFVKPLFMLAMSGLLKGKKHTEDATIAVVEKYKGIRRIILIVLTYWLYVVMKITITMYQLNGTLDATWGQIVIAYMAMYGGFISFYTWTRRNSFDYGSSYLYNNNNTSLGETVDQTGLPDMGNGGLTDV